MSELLGAEIDVEETLGRMLNVIATNGGIIEEVTALEAADVLEIDHQYKRMIDRNKNIV